jgi:zinc transport system substrate-binding protein
MKIKQINNLSTLLKILLSFSFLISYSSLNAEVKVVTTIKPIHSLVAGVMDGLGSPSLIVDGSNSPHNFSLKPSHAKMIEDAEIIFWVGEDLETFMIKSLESIANNATKVSFMDLDNITKLKFKEENILEVEGYDDDHDDHDDHYKHADGEFDAHIWLDPKNAIEIVNEIAKTLSLKDPNNKNVYYSNAEKLNHSLNELIKKINLSINKDARFIVFHDAYQYFEKRFDVSSAGALILNEEALPSAKKVSEIHKIIKKQNINCIISEPQFNPNIIKSIAQDSSILTGSFDPLGSSFDTNKNLYFEMILSLSNSLKDC